MTLQLRVLYATPGTKTTPVIVFFKLNSHEGGSEIIQLESQNDKGNVRRIRRGQKMDDPVIGKDGSKKKESRRHV